jgi:hypothetical protein
VSAAEDAAAWVCEAYGPESVEFGALCFRTGELAKRVCADQAECHQVMAAERRRVFRRISERAAAGDPAMAWLEGEFSSPEQMLGGGQDQEAGQ